MWYFIGCNMKSYWATRNLKMQYYFIGGNEKPYYTI